jgi:hypothetical protein
MEITQVLNTKIPPNAPPPPPVAEQKPQTIKLKEVTIDTSHLKQYNIPFWKYNGKKWKEVTSVTQQVHSIS